MRFEGGVEEEPDAIVFQARSSLADVSSWGLGVAFNQSSGLLAELVVAPSERRLNGGTAKTLLLNSWLNKLNLCLMVVAPIAVGTSIG